MIQRIQTVYYFLAILCLAIPMAGMAVFKVFENELVHKVTLFGAEQAVKESYQEPLGLPELPMFIGNLLVILLLLMTLFSYKNLKRQASTGRIAIFAYLFLLVGFCIIGYFLTQWGALHKMTTSFGAAFYFMAAGLLFVFLGNRGVKGDRKLLDSLNRLR